MKDSCDSLLSVAFIILSAACFFAGEVSACAGEPEDPPSGYIMKLERSGGYIGRQDAFWIYPGGKVLNSEGNHARISAESIAEWQELLRPFPDKNLEADSVSQWLCMDCYHYGITVFDEDRPRFLLFTYPLAQVRNGLFVDVGRIFDTLANLPWK